VWIVLPSRRKENVDPIVTGYGALLKSRATGQTREQNSRAQLLRESASHDLMLAAK
jgi:hypothetical protein